MPYGDFDEALALAARGRGSLVATLVTHDPKVAAQAIPQMAAWHGRLLILDREAARRVDRPRLAAADAQARRPRPRRRRRGARRHPRRPALPAARRGPGLADDADGGDRRVRARRGAARRRGPSVPQALRGAADRRLAADAPAHRQRGRHRRLRRHLGRLLLHALRRDRGEGVGVRQAHRPRLLRALGGGGPVRLAGARAGARQLRPRHAALRQAGRRSATRSAPASPASARSTATGRTRKARARASSPGTWRSPTRTTSWSRATTS